MRKDRITDGIVTLKLEGYEMVGKSAIELMSDSTRVFLQDLDNVPSKRASRENL